MAYLILLHFADNVFFVFYKLNAIDFSSIKLSGKLKKIDVFSEIYCNYFFAVLSLTQHSPTGQKRGEGAAYFCAPAVTSENQKVQTGLRVA